MFSKFTTRREFLNCGKLSILFLLNSCTNLPNKVTIALQNSFYPESFKDTIPKDWKQEKINFENIQLQKTRNIIFNADFTLINDGWINSIDFAEFEKINEYPLIENLDKRSIDFLESFNKNQRSKLFPIGVVPYTIIIKNNKELINSARTSWDFLLSKKLTGKIIFPKSPRIILSIAQKINSSNSLKKLKSQAMLFDDKNMLNWLINSDACVAITRNILKLLIFFFSVSIFLSCLFLLDSLPKIFIPNSLLNIFIFFNFLNQLSYSIILEDLGYLILILETENMPLHVKLKHKLFLEKLLKKLHLIGYLKLRGKKINLIIQ